MLDLAIMLEGQNGLNWPRFKRIVRAVEYMGFAGLYRSDHYTNAGPPDLDSLELWVSLTWLASNTSRIDFGPLVTPVSFRHPTLTARMAAAVDDLSGGRLWLGLGAGWQDREHHNFGRDLLSEPERFQRFDEGLEVITRLLRSDEPVSFAGRYFYLDEAILLPRPQRPGGPPILVGGNGTKYTLPRVVKYGAMWNCVYLRPDQFKKKSEKLDQMLVEAGRKPGDVHRSMMTGCWYGRDEAAIQKQIDAHPRYNSIEEVRQRGVLIGTASQLVDQIGELEEAGVQRIMLQWLDLDDIDGLEGIARDVMPQVAK